MIVNRWQRGVQIYNYPLISAPFVFFATLAVIGVGLSAVRTFVGLSFTGMTDDYAWGVWKTFNVMTLTALGSGGLAVGLMAWVFNKTKLHVVMRVALASSLLFYATGMLALTFDVGRPWNLYHLLLPWNWNTHSSLFEVALCMSAYVAIFLLYENIPPILDRAARTASPQRKADIEKWIPRLRTAYPFMIAGAYVLPMMHQSSLGSLMVIAGHKVHPLWQTQMLPAFYLIQAIVCGFAAVIFILMASCLAWRRPLDMDVLSDLARYMAWTSLGFVILRFVDLLVRGALGLAFQPNWYAILFHLENLLVLVPAVLILGNKVFRVTPRAVFISSIVTSLGGMLYRFTPTTIAYRAGTTSIYFPTVAELLMMLGYMGLAVVLFIWAAKRFEIIPAPAEEWVAAMEYEKKLTSELRTNEYGAATGY